MARLIDADELIQVLDRKYGGEENVDESVFYCIGAIIGAPTVNPVKYGHWISRYHDENGCNYYTHACSRCFVERLMRTRYCPTCGAKMDGVET